MHKKGTVLDGEIPGFPRSTGKIIAEIHVSRKPGIIVRLFLEFPFAEPGTEIIFLPFVGRPECRIVIHQGITYWVVRHRYHTPEDNVLSLL
jgi:hypothetical protein